MECIKETYVLIGTRKGATRHSITKSLYGEENPGLVLSGKTVAFFDRELLVAKPGIGWTLY